MDVGNLLLNGVGSIPRDVSCLLVALFCIGAAPLSSAEDIQAGKLKAEVACQTCHGTDGLATMAMVPNLSGQREDYTIIQLEAYRSGKRQHPQMSIIAQSLSDEDIRNLAAWYASIQISVAVPAE